MRVDLVEGNIDRRRHVLCPLLLRPHRRLVRHQERRVQVLDELRHRVLGFAAQEVEADVCGLEARSKLLQATQHEAELARARHEVLIQEVEAHGEARAARLRLFGGIEESPIVSHALIA